MVQPKLDAQKDVYTGILAKLDKAVGNFEEGKSFDNCRCQDIACKGLHLNDSQLLCSKLLSLTVET